MVDGRIPKMYLSRGTWWHSRRWGETGVGPIAVQREPKTDLPPGDRFTFQSPRTHDPSQVEFVYTKEVISPHLQEWLGAAVPS